MFNGREVEETHFIADDLGLNRDHDRIVANMHHATIWGIGLSCIYGPDWIERWDHDDIERYLGLVAEFQELYPD
jgi:hypothetical protein